MNRVDLSPAGKRFWGTRKRGIFVTILEEGTDVTLENGAWSGGSRSHYYTRNKHGTCHGVVNSATPIEFGGTVHTYKMTNDVALVREGTFCGKPATPHIFITSKDGWVF